MKSTAALGEPKIGQADSELVGAVRRSNREIERRGNMLLSNGDGLSELELMKYCVLASDMGYRRMEETGRQILNEGGTFPAMRITSLVRYRNGYALRAVEEGTGIEFILPCEEPLKQYVGGPVNLSEPNALRAYMREQVAIDVSRAGSGYKAILIGLSRDVLGDAPQAARLDMIR